MALRRLISFSSAAGTNEEAMITSACGPAAMASATSSVTSPPMATTPPNAVMGSHSRARSYAVTRLPATAAPQGLACLMMATATCPASASASAELMNQTPRRVAVEDVEVGQRAAPVLHHAVPPAARSHRAVARAALVRVLAVAQHVGALERELQGRREDGRELGLFDIVRRRALEIRDRCRPAGIEPRDDGRVVGGSVGEGSPGESAPRGGRAARPCRRNSSSTTG